MFSIQKKENSLVIFSDSETIQSIEIFNLQGQKVYSKRGIYGYKIEIDTQNLQSKIYLLKINSGVATFLSPIK